MIEAQPARSEPDSRAVKLSHWRIAGYSSGNFGKNILANTLVYFLIFYATDILGLAPETAGAIALIAMIWDAALDPAIGFIADRSRTRFGKYGLYILLGAPLTSVFLILVFVLPVRSSDPALVLLLTLMAFKFFYTLIDLPHNALMARISADSRERTTIATTRALFSSLGSLSIALGAFVIFDDQAAGGQDTRFAWFACAAAALSLAAMWTAWLSVARLDQGAPYLRPNFADQLRGLKAILTHKNALIILAVCFLSGATAPLFARGLPYYSKYNLENEGLVAAGLFVLVAGQAISIPLWMRLATRMEKSTALAIAHGVGIAALIGFFLSPATDGVGFWAIIFGVGAAGGGVWSIVWAMAPDIVDWIEVRKGVRPEAVMMALASDAMKVGLALGALVFGLSLEAAGFQADVAQTRETLLGVKAVMAGPAIVGSIGAIACLAFYSLTHETHRRLSP